jgi:co-chaperonin GroES (HSP10)
MSTLLKSPITSRMKINMQDLAERDHKTPFKDLVFKNIGNLDDYVVLGDDVLVATYVKTGKTAGGIILTDKSVDEDRWQGKVGLVLKLGESAFKYEGPYEYKGTVPKIGSYIVFHTSDTREIGIKGFSCRTISSSLVRMIIPDEAADAIY